MFNRIKKGRNKILEKITYQKLGTRLIFFILACFIHALNYNTLLVPNNIVVGGMSGLAIIIKEVTGLPTTYFLYISMIVIIIISYLVLGKEDTITTIVGSVTFTLMVTITEPLSKMIDLNINSMFITIVISSLLYGFCSGMIYRTGFNTGGSDVIATIINKMLKIPVGEASRTVNLIIIFTGTLVFGFTKTIYALFILFVASKLVDVVMLGINDSKICYIKSKKWEEIEKTLINNHGFGLTEVSSRGGIFIKKDPTLLVIVPFDKYYGLKKMLLEKDKNVFMVSHDCYAVTGGYRRKYLPF